MRRLCCFVVLFLSMLCVGCTEKVNQPELISSTYIDDFIDSKRDISQVEESRLLTNNLFDEFTALRIAEIVMEEYWGQEPFQDTICIIREYQKDECYKVERIPKEYKKTFPIYRVILNRSGKLLHIEKVEESV